MHPSLIGALLLAAITTAGDYAWFEYGIRHSVVAGILHGMVMMGSLGAVLGFSARRPAIGFLGGVAAGVLGAAMFYALWRVLGWGAMFVSWSAVWLGLAAFDHFVLRKLHGSSWILRGLAAAILGGIAFYLISGVWTNHGEDPNYLWHFVSWFIAWWPGLAALTFGRRNAA